MSQLTNDFRFGWRTLKKNPGFAITAILALALGIGANSAVFSVVNSVLLKPLPFPQSERIVKIWGALANLGIPKNWISAPEFVDLTQQTSSFSDIAAFTDGNSFNYSGSGDPERFSGTIVTPGFFSVLRAKVLLGRDFHPDEGAKGADHVVILSYPLWKRRFGGDPQIVGRNIQLNGAPFQVIGVMAAGVDYPEDTHLWAPTKFSQQDLVPDNRGNHGNEVIARLKDGISIEQAQTDLTRLAQALQKQFSNNYPSNVGWSLTAFPLITEITGDTRPALLVLMGAVGLVLLIACVNVANLLLSRAAARKREMAIRSAIGASKWRIIRQLLTESLTLAMLGGIVGLVLAYGALRLFRSAELPGFPRMTEVAMDSTVLLFTVIVTFVTGVLFGLAPALQLSELSLLDSLKLGGSQGKVGGGGHRLRKGLVVAEVGLTLTLLFGAGLLLRSFMELQKVSPGIDPANLLTMRVSLMEARYQKDETQQVAFFQHLDERLAQISGVTSVGSVSGLPLRDGGGSGSTMAEGQPNVAGQGNYEADRRSITPNYLRTMGIRLQKGRPFTSQDTATSPKVVIVDDVLVEHFWPHEDAIGKRIRAGSAEMRSIVGVVNHVKNKDLESAGRGQVYYPLAQRPRESMFLAIKTQGDPMSMLGQVRSAINEVDSNQPIYEIKPMQSLVDASLARRRFSSFLLASFAVIALVLAIFGVYGVTSYLVTQRTQEIGIRMALGADRKDIFKLILSSGMAPVALGLGVGAIGVIALSRVLRTLLFGVKPADPVTMLSVVAALVAATFLANYIPTLRAMRVEPIEALRSE